MTLFDLSQGKSAQITKVNGSGAFRKRILEMGFVVGKEVAVIKKAPLQDPTEYKIMGYHVTLRNNEAKLIEIASGSDKQKGAPIKFSGTFHPKSPENQRKATSQVIKIALVGNPNSGKTTIFNDISGLSEKVGNYSGVTVDAKLAKIKHGDYRLHLIDLPGTYSITAYSPEELFVRKYITDYKPDVVINIIDAGNIERNLYLTTQLIDMNIKVVVALNMYDELQKKGDVLEVEKLSQLLGIPFIPTIGNKSIGIDDLLDKAIEIYKDNDPIARNIQINYGKDLEDAITSIETAINEDPTKDSLNCSMRFTAIKLLEDDQQAIESIHKLSHAQEIIALGEKYSSHLKAIYHEDCETLITDAKYAFIAGALLETYKSNKNKTQSKSQKIDTLLTHKWLGIPIFALFMWLTFWITFTLGEHPMQWIEGGIELLNDAIGTYMPEGILKNLLTNGIIGGIGAVLVFIPNIVLLYFFISLMEDTGYMARAVFIMDRVMHKIGLHGKSFIPLLMGFGCNVPAITATRTIESRRDRIITMLIIPFMSCSARLPVYILFISAFFTSHQATIMFSLYLLGILLAIGSSLLFSKTVFKKADLPFVMELPPYRMPTNLSLIKHMWGSAEQYLKKMGGVILIASIIIWALGYFPQNISYSKDYDNDMAQIATLIAQEEDKEEKNDTLIEELSEELSEIQIEKNSEQQSQSYIGRIGRFIEPTLAPMGFDWKMSVGILTGIAAKEIVIGSLGVLYKVEDAEENSALLSERLKSQRYTSGPKKGEAVITPVVAFSYLVFILIYFPCIAVVAAVKKESGQWKYAIFQMIYTTGLAWIFAFLSYKIGILFF